jgi:hypothetical protein
LNLGLGDSTNFQCIPGFFNFYGNFDILIFYAYNSNLLAVASTTLVHYCTVLHHRVAASWPKALHCHCSDTLPLSLYHLASAVFELQDIAFSLERAWFVPVCVGLLPAKCIAP